MGAGALVGAGKGNAQIWGRNFHFGLANLYLVVYTESETKDIVAWDGWGLGAVWEENGAFSGKSRRFPPRFPVRRGTVFPRNPEKRGREA